MSTKFLSPGWRMPRNANQSKFSNYSMDFDGSQSVDVGTVTINNSGSFSIWFKISNIAYYQNILGSSNASGMFKYITLRNGILYQYVLGTGWIVLYSTSLDDNEWHNLVFTYDSTTSGGPARGTFKSYVDGVLTKTYDMINDVSEDWSSSTLASIAYFGTTQPLGARYFDGQITEVSIFDYALSASQATTLWGGGTSVSNPMALPSPPIAYYPLGGSAAAFRTPVNTGDQWLIENNAIGDYVFDFDSDYITVPDSSDLQLVNTDFSISFWINPSSTGNYILMDKYAAGSGWGVYLQSGSLRFVAFPSSWQTITTISQNVWTHVLIVGDNSGNNLLCYKNGAEVYNSSYTLSISSNTTNLIIGSENGTGFFTNGELSNVQIFDTALSSTEAETLYNYGSPIRTLANIPQSSNLKAWYKLDASEVYNSTTTEWSVDNNQNPSAYPSSLNFTNDVVQSAFPAPASLNSSVFSYSIWVKVLTSAGFEEVLMGNFSGTGADIRFKGNENRIYFRTSYSNQTYQDEALVDDGGWHHIVATCDGTNLKIYVDKAKGTDGAGSYTSNTIVFKVGGGAQGNMQNVLISNACYFNTALSQSEIDTLYNNGTPLTDMSSFSSLVSWWKLNNMSAGIQDSKGSNNLSGSGPTEYAGFVNALAGESSGMSQANLVQSDLQTVAPYSKYALDFDRGSSDSIDVNMDLSSFSSITVSTWVKFNSTTGYQYVYSAGTGSVAGDILGIGKWTSSTEIYSFDRVNANRTGVSVTLNTWNHILVTHTGTTRKVYLNGSLIGTFTSGNLNLNSINFIGRYSFSASNYMDGSISNVSIWNTDLTSAQVSEIYNQGLPGNLNSHSAYSNLVSWWQLGENSSFDGNDWIVADEKGTNNGTSVSMPVGALVNGVGTTANGVSSGMSEGSLVGDAPYSTANAISTNMVVTSRLKEVPPNFDTSSFLYDGIDEYFSGSSVYSSLDGLSNYAVSCWFRSPNYSETNEILHTSSTTGSILNQVRVYTRFDRRVLIDHGSNGNYQTYSDNTTLVNNQWYHILCTRDASRGIGDKMRIYINGVDKTATDNTRYAGGLITANQPLFMAKASNSNSNEMEGELDEIAIYNQDMASYVSEIYAGGKVVNLNNLATAPNPISYFRSEKATWDGGNWSMKDINSTYTVTSSNMEQADKTTNVP